MVIFVGNFSGDTSEQELLDKFEQYGQVAAVNVIKDEITEHVLGFGFVEMPDSAAAYRAIAELNHTTLRGATLIVCETAPRIERRRFAQKQPSSKQMHTADQG
ncbi:MAG: RNA-binding protein [Phycisphaerales bacterium]